MKTNRVVVITGAGGGIGSELVDRFLSNGDTIIASDMNQDALDRWRGRFDATAPLVAAAADISSEHACHALADIARERFGRADVLVNCAGWFPIVPFDQLSADDWRKVIDINLTGTFLMTRAILPLMKDNGWGRIINFGSGSVFAGPPDQAHYVAAKAGVLGFSRSLAREVGSYGITVNIIAPGVTVTESVRASFPQPMLAAARNRRAIHRDETPADVAGPVYFLASDDAGFVTGQTILVDGGAYMP